MQRLHGVEVWGGAWIQAAMRLMVTARMQKAAGKVSMVRAFSSVRNEGDLRAFIVDFEAFLERQHFGMSAKKNC